MTATLTAPEAVVGTITPEPKALARTGNTASALTAPEANFGSMMDLAQTLIASGFLPRHVQKPAQAVAIILTGREMGLGPMAALRSIYMVEGKPTLAADLCLGLFKRAGGQATFTRLDEKGAVLRLRHPNGDEHVEQFLEADAQRAGLLGKDVWKKYPKAMYRSRVITAGIKSIGFETLAGVYDPEEMEVRAPLAAPAAPPPPISDGRQAAEAADDDGEVIRVALDTPLPFGKAKGKTVAAAGLAYFRRVVNNAEPKDHEARWYLFSRAAVDLLERESQEKAAVMGAADAAPAGVAAAADDQEDDLPF